MDNAAGDGGDAGGDYRQPNPRGGEGLRRKVPEPDSLDRYRADIGRLLDLSASREVDDDYLEAQYGAVTRRLVRSTAWQESCWRQFVVKGRRITYLESSTKDIGLMQVNRYVWRGFYSVARLEWDVAYNAGAGAQILLRRLRDCARNAAGQGIGATSEELARSAYSAYNGAPRPVTDGVTRMPTLKAVWLTCRSGSNTRRWNRANHLISCSVPRSGTTSRDIEFSRSLTKCLTSNKFRGVLSTRGQSIHRRTGT